jgi:putative peptidoglycan lipid II flippase
LFPGAGLLVLSAWCLGVLNSHHRFPAVVRGARHVERRDDSRRWRVWRELVAAAACRAAGLGSVIGSFVQFAVQVPVVLRLAPDLRFALDIASGHVKIVTRNFVPVFISRGVVQVSAYIDALLASLLPTGAVTGIANAQLLYTLPISLFGMSVCGGGASPILVGRSRCGRCRAPRGCARRLDDGPPRRDRVLRRPPSAMAFLRTRRRARSGRCSRAGASALPIQVYVWGIPGGFVCGVCSASTLGRRYSSTYYALREHANAAATFALIRVALTVRCWDILFAIPLPRMSSAIAQCLGRGGC